jgi:hypothetical protein
MRFATLVVPVNMPDLGEGGKAATIRQWFVKEGQPVKQVSMVTLFICSMRTCAKSSLTRP